jgi:SAM-dependent methyltransferase
MSSTQQQPQKSIFRTGYNKASLDRYAYRTAATCCAYLLPYLKFLPSNFTFLDIGCGPGSITTDLASRFPHARFIGIDPGKLFLEKAKSLAQECGVTANTTFQLGDVTSLEEVLGTQVGTFDVVHCHQVLNHLSDPVAALKIMKAAAKSEGGIVAAREATTSGGDIFYPLLPGIKKWQKLAATTMGSPESKTGSVPGFGPRLLETALHAGWTRDKIHAGAGVWCYSEPAEKRMWVESMVGMLENKESDWYKKNLAKGATEDDLAQMSGAWKEWEKRDESWCVFVSAEIVCRNG